MISRHLMVLLLALAAFTLPPPSAAWAQIALNKIILDFAEGQPLREDIEVVNNSNEPAFIVVEPARIDAPGLAGEQRVSARDPDELGLIVTPNRMVLQPGERKLVRVAVIDAPRERDRVFRVTVKPVAGEVQAQETALQILVGYEVLVIVRPAGASPDLLFSRDGRRVRVTNSGNTNALLSEGRQCDASGSSCVDLPAKRLYAGASWDFELEGDAPAEYYVSVGDQVTVEQF